MGRLRLVDVLSPMSLLFYLFFSKREWFVSFFKMLTMFNIVVPFPTGDIGCTWGDIWSCTWDNELAL